MTEETADAAYERGVVAGEVAARLAGHDRHFASINGSLARLVDEMHALTLGVQRLSSQAESSAAAVLTTAAALKDAEEARRDRADQSWSPWTKAFAVVAAVSTAVTLYLALKH